MIVEKTVLDGVLLIKLESFEDFRGTYKEIYNKKLYEDNGININFIQDDTSASIKGVFRGIHGDASTWKLISCLYGEFMLVVANCDKESDAFGTSQSFILSESNNIQILIPPKHGNGHLVLSERTIFHYKQSTYYQGAENQFTYRWDEPKFGFEYPIKNPILSARDKEVPYIKGD